MKHIVRDNYEVDGSSRPGFLAYDSINRDVTRSPATLIAVLAISNIRSTSKTSAILLGGVPVVVSTTDK